MANASRPNVVDTPSTSGDNATEVAALTTDYDIFNNTIKPMLNVTSMVELQTCNVAVNYVELEIENAIRLYYQVFIALFGIVANVLALVVTLSKRMRKHSTCLYMSAISGSDAISLAISFVWWLERYVNTRSVWSCKLILFCFFYATHFSDTVVVAMTAERFVAIRFPFWAHVHLTRRKSVYVIIGVAMAVLALDAHNLITRTMLVNANGCHVCFAKVSETLDMSYGFFYIYIWPWIDASVSSFFPSIALAIFNPLIIHTVRQRAAEQKQLSDGGIKPGQGTSQKGTEQQITTMLLFVTFSFIILTTPIAVTLILEKSWVPPKEAHGRAIWQLWRTIASNMMCTNHAINFLLYSLSGQKFRRELRRIFQCCNVLANGESKEISRNVDALASGTSVNDTAGTFTSIDTRM